MPENNVQRVIPVKCTSDHSVRWADDDIAYRFEGMQDKSPYCKIDPVNIAPTFIKIAPSIIKITPINKCNEEINLIIKSRFVQ
jgi:hypothetical protein